MSKIISKPVVYVLGAQEVRESGFSRFLQDHNIDWQSDTEIPSQVLIEAAGRTCFDDRTELLTRTGWKPVSEVSIADEIATLNPETRHLEYQKPIAYHEYDYKGDLLTTEGRDVSFAVTPEHRQFVSLGGKFDWKDFNFIQTKDLSGKRFKIITAPENWIGEFPEKIIFPAVEFNQIISNQYNKYGESTTLLKPIKIKNTKLLSELVAHYIANGSICSAKGTGHGIVIYGREFKEICNLAQGLGFKTNVCEDKRNGCKRTKINGGKVLAHWFEKECGRGFRAKRFPQWVMNLPKEQLHVIWSILVKTDGHRYKNGREIVSTGSITVSGQLQEMLCKMGFSSYITCKVTNDVPCWTVSKKAGNPAVRSGSAIEKVSYIGKVYCPTTDNGIVYIRRNGKVHFSGNCYMSFEKPRPGGNKAYLAHIKEVGHGSVLEHGVWNFLFTNVSRSLTHELVRHRAGMSYCLAGDTVVCSGSKQKGRFDGVKKSWTIRQLYEWSQDPQRKGRLKLIKLRCWDGSEFVQTGIKAITNSGVKQIFKVTLEDGKTIRCSKNHRFLSQNGWQALKMFNSGDCLATNGLPAVGLAKDYLEDRYHKKGWLLAEIAKESNCSSHTVRKWISRYGLSKPHGTGMIGRTPPNKGTTYTTGYHHSEETKQKLREMKIGERNPKWKGNSAGHNAGRLRAQRYFAQEPCTRCGNPNGHRHHIDRNTFNNDKQNIQFLCNKCHALTHYEEDGPFNRLVVKWVKIVSIVPDGHEETFDIEVNHHCHNFVANGIVTHNSQLSQRYVDEANTDFIVPSIIEEDKELYEEWLSCVAKCSDTYKSLTQKITEKLKKKGKTGTDLKKTARQAARSVLPNATETKIFVTGNVRSIRHFLEQRGNAAAEWEIRQLANIVLDVMMTEAPHLFGDYNLTPLEDGTFEIKTPYPKV